MRNKFKLSTLLFLTFTLLNAQEFKKVKSEVFSSKVKKQINLFENSKSNKLIVFKTGLEVNTDGTPISYHPMDLKGKKLAINSIGNGSYISKNGINGNLAIDNYGEAISVFEQFRDSNYETIPAGYNIKWDNILIPEIINGKQKPCIIKTGKYAGYFASATSLKNGLNENKGECDCDNQVNSLDVCGFVLPKGNNILKKFGANLGDLLVAFNTKNSKLIYAIIYDKGPNDKVGEGSVLLNKNLLNKDSLPANKQETYNFSIANDVIIIIFPNSNTYKDNKPYKTENINLRVKSLIEEYGFANNEAIVQFIKDNISKI